MSLDTSRVGVLCFDVDGTLSDTDDAIVQRLSNWLKIFKVLFPHQDLHQLSRRIVMALESPAQALYGLPDRANLDHYLIHLTDWLRQRRNLVNSPTFWLIPGVKEALFRLKEHYPMSVVSSRDERTTDLFLRQHELEGYFDYVATALTCLHTKPHPDPILWVAKQMKVMPSHCLMIGDTTVDMLAAKGAGAQAIGVLSGFGQKKELLRAGADVIIQSVAELPKILCC